MYIKNIHSNAVLPYWMDSPLTLSPDVRFTGGLVAEATLIDVS